MKIGGAILILLGVVVLVWAAFGFRTREKVLDLGPIEATRETTHYTPYGPIVGGMLLVGGVVLVVAARKA
jgi:drug/metabolite transporter (DMT)-like permease